MDLVLAFFTYLPLHFWDAVNLIFTGPVDLMLLISIAFYAALTLIQYIYVIRALLWFFDRMFY